MHIPYGRHDVNEADIQSVIDVLRSDFLTQGRQFPHLRTLWPTIVVHDMELQLTALHQPYT